MPAYKDKQRGTRYYGLTENPVRVAGSIGKKKAGVMKFWTVEEFNAVIVNVTSFPARVGLSVLFWTGMRIGELLGLSVSDVNFEAGTISITKSYNKINGKEIITEPKTPKSKRVISMPSKLQGLIRAYISTLYDIEPEGRLFQYSRGLFQQWIIKGADAAGVERIRIHDLRHSHASLLINMGYPVLLVSERLGHEDIQTTLSTYGHLYNKTSEEAVKKLDDLML